MATRLEMETRLKELEVENKSLVEKFDPKAVDARTRALELRIKQLEEEVDLAREANERLNANIVPAEEKAAALRAQLKATSDAGAELRSAVEKLGEERDAALARERELFIERGRLSSELLAFETLGAVKGDHAVVDGAPFKIIARTTSKWCNLLYLRREVPEDATTLVLDRVGE